MLVRGVEQMRPGRQTRGHDGQSRNRTPRLHSVTRYDIVLALLGLAILLPAVASGVLGVSLHAALAAGSLLGVAVIVDALFVNPPGDGGPIK